MKKILRVALAEFNKLFLRPAMFILTAILIVAIVFLNIIFKPETKIEKFSYPAISVSEVYTKWTGTDEEKTKQTIDNNLNKVYVSIEDDYNNITESKDITDLQTHLSVITSNITAIYEHLLTIQDNQSSSSFNREESIKVVKKLETSVEEASKFVYDLQRGTATFFITQNQFDTINHNLEEILAAIPNTLDEFVNPEQFINLLQSIKNACSIDVSFNIAKSLKTITINAESFDGLEKQYLNSQTALIKKQNEIFDFYTNNIKSKKQEDIQNINLLVSQYNSIANMTLTSIQNNFTLMKIGDKVQTEIEKFYSFEEVDKYALSEQYSIATHLLNEGKYDFDFLNNFNFYSTSGSSTNAFDYTVYSMQILIIFIILFTIYFTVNTFAYDQQSGIMKMTAIRPYSRTKILFGKILSVQIFALTLMFISTIASFVVGNIMFPVQSTTVITALNSTTVYTLNAYAALSLYFLSLFMNVIFYISLTVLLCFIVKSPTLSLILSSFVYVIQVVLNGVVNSAWLLYTPYAHMDMFKFFGNGKFGFFANNILPNANFLVSLAVILGSVVIINIINYFIFRRKDIA